MSFYLLIVLQNRKYNLFIADKPLIRWMIPGANYKIQSFKHKSAHEENSQKNKTNQSKSVTETKFNPKEKIKTRLERQKPLVK